MKGRGGLISALAGLIILLVGAWYLSPEEVPPFTWNEEDERAFGGYLLHQFTEDYTKRDVVSVYKPINEYFEDYYETNKVNIIVASEYVEMSQEDWQGLEGLIEEGSTAIIAAHQIYGPWAPYLQAEAEQSIPDGFSLSLQDLLSETILVSYSNIPSFPHEVIEVPKKAGAYQFRGAFKNGDSTLSPVVLAKNEYDKPVLLEYQIGEGSLLLSTMPELLSNYFLMDSLSRSFSQGIFSYLDAESPNYHFEFYHLGRLESSSPLRVALAEPALQGAVYILALLSLIYIFIGGKRRQRAIPPKLVLHNDNLDFLEKLSFLYHKTGHHQNLLRKRMQFFQSFLEQQYRIRLRPEHQEVFEEIIQKLEPDPKIIGILKQAYQMAFDKNSIVTANQLLLFEQALHNFYQVPHNGRKQ